MSYRDKPRFCSSFLISTTVSFSHDLDSSTDETKDLRDKGFGTERKTRNILVGIGRKEIRRRVRRDFDFFAGYYRRINFYLLTACSLVRFLTTFFGGKTSEKRINSCVQCLVQRGFNV